jgi:XTP/dITP diphosphohydrolase
MERIRVVLATGNLGKVREISQLIGDVVELIPYEGALPEETGTTYAENAFIKAKAAFDKYNLPSLADDSGLEVDFLGGQPGVHSNRFLGLKSDQEKYMRILKLLKGVPWQERTARFRCLVCYVDKTGTAHYFEGVAEGYIATEPAGEGGFGYDPVFYYPPLQKTFAQLPAQVKNQISHRSQAFLRFKQYYLSTIENIRTTQRGGENKHE